jgi:hypothetical protein
VKPLPSGLRVMIMMEHLQFGSIALNKKHLDIINRIEEF